MKCAEHIAQDAVATCQTCGRGLCTECTSIFDRPLCEPCARQENRSAIAHNEKLIGSAKRTLVLPAILFPVGLTLLIANGAVHDVSTFFRAVVLAGLLAMTPAGWSFLNRYFTPGGGYIFLTARWLNAFLHLTLSVLLGIVVGPYQIWVSIRDIAELRRINAGILAGGYV